MNALFKKAMTALFKPVLKTYFKLGKGTSVRGEYNWTSMNYSKRRGKFKKRNRQYL